jgi:hypothetical protein
MSFLPGLSSAFTTLTSLGLTPAQAASGVQSLFGGASSAAKPMLAVIAGSYTNAAVVQDEVTKLMEIPNLPASAAPLIGTLGAEAAAAASNPAAGLANLMTIINDIEAALSANSIL